MEEILVIVRLANCPPKYEKTSDSPIEHVRTTALLTAQAAQGKVKTYDAVKLEQYSACLQTSESIDWISGYIISKCAKYKPQPSLKSNDYPSGGEKSDYRGISHFFRVGKNGISANTLLTP